MDLGKFTTGIIIGGGIGLASAMYAMTSDKDRKKMIRQGKRMVNKSMDQVKHFM